MIRKLCRLNESRKAGIRRVEERCMAVDGTRHRMYLESDCNLDRFMKCFYIEEKNGVPRSVLAITNMEPGRAEITAFTDPDWRGCGLFTKLWNEAADMLRERGFEKVSFVCEPESRAGRAVLNRLGAKREKSEYLMELRVKAEGAGTGAMSTISRAAEDDREPLTVLLAKCFRMPRDYAKARVWGQFAEGNLVWKAVIRGTAGETVEELAGMCVAAVEGNSAFLYDICVARSRRGQGIGTRLVAGAAEELAKMGIVKIGLQVSSRSRAAVRLYRKLGFEERDRIDYYKVGIEFTE
ncbi:MAG: GNAT family N-acetyltransferase [Lachnospiraceae bacterium]|nr:GNAT family N-acetyltransferase [Lachnospiraceae bacterium]